MDALNFLRQKPTLNWLDFYLEPVKLEQHLSQSFPEPDHEQLIAQFCDQAALEEHQQTTSPEMPSDEMDYHRNKSKRLWCLALKVCAMLNWNLKSLRSKCHLVHMKRLMEELCEVVCGTNNLATVLTDKYNFPASSQTTELALSTRLLFARWIVDVTVRDAFVTPPPKITVSNPSAQIDPSVVLMDAKSVAIKELKSIADLAVRLLTAVVNENSTDGEMFLLKPQFFIIPCGSDPGSIMQCDNNERAAITSELNRLQCAFDLVEYNFYLQQYALAKNYLSIVVSHNIEQLRNVSGYFTFNSELIRGYCRALQVEYSAVKEGTQELSMVSTLAEEHKNANQKSLSRFGQMHSSNFVTSLGKRVAVLERDLHFLRRPENVAMFCLALKNKITSELTTVQRKIILVYLRFLSSSQTSLFDALKGCGVLDQLDSAEVTTLRRSLVSVKSDDSVLDLGLLSKLEPTWQLLQTFDSAELKAVASGVQPNRVSSHFLVPAPIQGLLLRLPPGILQDLVALASCKAQQLTLIGSMTPVSALLDLASHEARSGLGETPPDLNWELVRLELIRWHNLLHRCADVQKMGQLTTELATKVKSFVVSIGQRGVNLPWELCMLVSSFLLNTRDWEYIIIQCPSFHRFIDFGKVLASLCYEVSKGSANVRNVARDFFDIMLPTMMDSLQYKRGASGQASAVVREAPAQLLSRAYFTAIVKNLKESCAISLLLSFFAKLFNGLQGGMEDIFAENLMLWPSTYVDSTTINDKYLKEILLITLTNAVLINPNNAFWLRARADFEFANEHFHSSLQFYLQSLLACSDAFSKPLPENVTDDRLISNMIKCCGRMECHTLEALLCQLLHEPNYGLALKALQGQSSYDGMDAYYSMIWDPALIELLNFIVEKSGQHGKLRLAMRIYADPDNNIHNDESIATAVAFRRKRAFLLSMCKLFF